MADAQRKQSKRPRTAEEREARRQEKQPASSSMYVDIEWPRPKGVAFELPSHITRKTPVAISKTKACLGRDFNTAWDEYDNFYYNGLMNVTFEPTRMFDIEFLRHVKWLEPLKELSSNLGLGTMPFKTYPLYPDLVHQFLSSCRVKFSFADRRAIDGSLIFKLDGGCYVLTFGEICALYGFDEGDALFIAERNEPIDELWSEITGIPRYDSATAKHTDVKHPVLRMFLRMLSNTLLCKMEPGKMRKTELVLLHFAIGHHFEYCEESDVEHRINFGSVFAHYLEELKDKGLSGTAKTESIGSLLTPIFSRVGIDLESRDVVTTKSLLDVKSLKHGKFLAGDWGKFRYRYRDHQGYLRQIGLPSPLCRVDSAEALRFRPLAGDFVRFADDADREPRRVDSEIAGSSRTRRSAAPATLPPFPMPPAGTYEDSPFNSWMVQTWKTLWDHIRATPRCCCTSDVVPPAHPTHSPTPPTHFTDQEDDDA